MAKRKKVLVIDRQKWMRGRAKALLLDKFNGKMCCLGFDALACGLRPCEIEGMPDPYHIAHYYPSDALATRVYFIGIEPFDNSPVVNKAIRINDHTGISDTERERKLIPVLKKLGYDEVQFVN